MLRIFLAVSIVVLNWAISSPPPTPPVGERVTIGKQESLFVTVAGPAVRLTQAILILATLCEAYIVLVAKYPHLASSTILSLLMCNESACSNIVVTPISLLTWAISVSGCLLRYSSIESLGSLFTHRLAIRKDHALITAGPYTFVRHPAYTGSIVAAVGTGMFFFGPDSYAYNSQILKSRAGAFCAAAWIGWKVFMCLNLVRRTADEDEFLRNKFGDSWVVWSQKVRYRLLPGVY